VLAQLVNELLTQARERNDKRRSQVIAIESVQLRRSCDGDVDDALPGQALQRASDAVGRVPSDYPMEAPPSERSICASECDKYIAVDGRRDHLQWPV